jgi:hypothetical protein
MSLGPTLMSSMSLLLACLALMTAPAHALAAASDPTGSRLTSRVTEVQLAPGSPVAVGTISDVCGNFGGFEPFAPSELASRYAGGLDEYLARYAAGIDTLVAQGFVLAAEKRAMLDAVAIRFRAGASP